MTASPVSEDLFRAALLDPDRPAPPGLIDGAARPAGKRFDVYRNNVAVSLGDALLTGFPVIARLLGEANMKSLAALYLRAHPPGSPLMMHYGQAFPDFIAAMPQLQHLGYLGDVARLELALRQSYHAADADPIAPDALARIAPERLADTCLGLAPSMIVLRSKWPLFDIWRFNSEPGAPKPRPVAQDVLITRPEFDPLPHALPPGGADWIAALAEGLPIGAAQDRAQAKVPEFDLGPPLALLLQGQAITSLTMKDTPP